MEEVNDGIGCVILLCFIAFFVWLGVALANLGPSAMDVYQGKTTLEYKVVNGEKIDSIVVWKEKKK